MEEDHLLGATTGIRKQHAADHGQQDTAVGKPAQIHHLHIANKQLQLNHFISEI